MRIISFLLLTLFLLASCSNPTITPIPPDTPISSDPDTGLPPDPSDSYIPEDDDANLSQGKVYLDSTDMLVLESYPVQINLLLKGSLPTPCHKLRVLVHEPDADKRIDIDVYSVVDSSLICIQVLEAFERTIPLGSFPTGHYTVWINSEKIGEFDS